MRPEKIEFENGISVKAYVRGCQYPYHWHDTLEIIQVLKGSINIDVGDHNLTLHENDIAIVNMGELHRITKTHEDNKILFIQIDGCFCSSVLPDDEYLFFYCCSAYHETEAPQKYKKLRRYTALLTSALMDNPRGEHKQNIESILVDMLDYLTYNFDFLRWGYGTTPFTEKLVNRLKQIAKYAISDLDVQLRLKELAVEVGVSLQHLSHDIKDKFGLTFLELLYYSRCAYAAKLLLSTDARIIDIAMACGFSDTKYLVKYFRQYFHTYPSAFRKVHRTDIQTLSSQVEYREYPLSHALSQRNILE
nr:helix-turn-helix transcriptional regulator [Desulfosporosinus youngiae]